MADQKQTFAAAAPDADRLTRSSASEYAHVAMLVSAPTAAATKVKTAAPNAKSSLADFESVSIEITGGVVVASMQADEEFHALRESTASRTNGRAQRKRAALMGRYDRHCVAKSTFSMRSECTGAAAREPIPKAALTAF